MTFQPDRAFNDLPVLPPSQEIETKAVLKACIEARAALAELKASGRLIPNQSVLINSIPLLEAQASSEIENIVTTCQSARNVDPLSASNLHPPVGDQRLACPALAGVAEGRPSAGDGCLRL